MAKQQIWGNHLTTPPSQLNISFCAGRDVKELPMCDEYLIHYDLWTNMAHTKMLKKVGILTEQEFLDIKECLLEIRSLNNEHKFKLDPKKEDVHINIEHFITISKEVIAGKKIHTGRSRNDQVTTDLRLYLRDQVSVLMEYVSVLIESIHKISLKELNTILPGFTHYQPAMISTVSHWFSSWSQGLLRDLKSLKNTYEILNRSPLGSAAAFGTSWPIDREYTADLLGFDSVDENTLDCITTRGENEARIASDIAILMNRLSNISQDLIMLTHPYVNFFKLDDEFVTGSSIMPQKRNPDFAEVIKAKTSFSHGCLTSLLGIQKASFSGYNRDTQQTKSLIMDLFTECLEAPLLLAKVLEKLEINTPEIQKKSELGFMNSADIADWLSQKYGLSFRDSYNIVASAVKYSSEEGKLTEKSLKKAISEQSIDLTINSQDLEEVLIYDNLIKQKLHTGAPSPESTKKMINKQNHHLQEFQSFIKKNQEKIKNTYQGCFE